MRSALRSLLCLPLLFTLLLGGCGKAPVQPEPAPPPADGEPVAGGTLTVALQDAGKTLDPHKALDAASMRLCENLYSTLFRYAEAYGEIEPDLATGHAYSEDRKHLTISLRDDVTFPSGRSFTAEDVKYSLKRIRELKARADQLAAVQKIVVVDPHTVRLELSRPMAPLLTYLAHPMNAMVDRTVVEANDGKLDRADAGCGPFVLDEWRQDLRCTMTRYEDYHVDGRPYLDALVYRPISDPTAVVTALKNAEIDLILDVPVKNAKLLEDSVGVRTTTVQGTFWEYVGINCTRPPLDQVKVRQAIAHAIDRRALNEIVKFGRATPLTGGNIPPNHWAHAGVAVYKEGGDPERARELLAEAGVDSLSLTLKVGSSFPYQVEAAQLVKQQLAKAGIEVKVQALESSIFFDDLNTGDFDLDVVGFLGSVDPDAWTFDIFHSEGKYNQQGYSNDEVDARLEQGRHTFDRKERHRLYAIAQKRIARDAPMAFLYANPRIASRRTTVRGFVVHPTVSGIFLRDTWLEGGGE